MFRVTIHMTVKSISKLLQMEILHLLNNASLVPVPPAPEPPMC